MPTRITKYKQAFSAIGVPYNSKAKSILWKLEENGRTEGSICFAIWKERETLLLHNQTPIFWDVFKEAVKKWSWSRDDPRWEEYRMKKLELEKARIRQEEIKRDIEERTYTSPYEKSLKGFIYFIQGEAGGPIKIGYTTDIEQRLRTLQTGYPDRLELLLAFPGKPEYEKAIHDQFNKYRLQGEWFRSAPEVLEKIQRFALLNAYVSRKPCKMC